MGLDYELKDNVINHVKYGKGTIISVEESNEGYWVIVVFDEVGEKKLLSLVDPREL